MGNNGGVFTSLAECSTFKDTMLLSRIYLSMKELSSNLIHIWTSGPSTVSARTHLYTIPWQIDPQIMCIRALIGGNEFIAARDG